MFLSKLTSTFGAILVLVPLLLGWAVQFILHVLLLDEPTRNTDFIVFLIYSVTLCLSTIFYIKFTKKQILLLFILLINNLFWIYFWGLTVTWLEDGNIALAIRYVGLLSTLTVVIYIFWKLIKKINKWVKTLMRMS